MNVKTYLDYPDWIRKHLMKDDPAYLLDLLPPDPTTSHERWAWLTEEEFWRRLAEANDAQGVQLHELLDELEFTDSVKVRLFMKAVAYTASHWEEESPPVKGPVPIVPPPPPTIEEPTAESAPYNEIPPSE